MVVNALQLIHAHFLNVNHVYNSVGSQLFWRLSLGWLEIAQTIQDPDLLGNWQKAFDNFIQSGQVWALLIGFVLGYIFRGLTSYG